MRIVNGIHSLAGVNGVQTYMATIGDVLQRNGHDVWCYAEEPGEGEKLLELSGIRCVNTIDALPEEVDIYMAHDTASALEMLERRPQVAQVFVWHGNHFDGNTDPQINGATKRILALTPGATRRTNGMAVKPPLFTLTQPVDLTRFRAEAPIGERPRRAVALSNYLGGESIEMLGRACRRAGIELRHIGAHGEGATRRPQDAINDADIVFGKGRAVVEAMACGRAAFVFDIFGSDGWVTEDLYEQLVAYNFSGTATTLDLDEDGLVSELGRYEQSMGTANQALVYKHHNTVKHASELVLQFEAVLAEGGRPVVHDDLYELKRMARVSWRHEAEAFQLNTRIVKEQLRRGDAEWELEKERARADRLQADLDRIHRSIPWRLSAPLRELRRKMR